MKIAPEGRPFIALGWSLTALAWWAAWRGGWSVGWSVVAAVLSLLAIWLVVFFRDPTRDARLRACAPNSSRISLQGRGVAFLRPRPAHPRQGGRRQAGQSVVRVATSAPRFRPLRLAISHGDPAPDAFFETHARDRFALHRFRGREVLLNFWQSWSAPCLAELGRLQHLYEAGKGTPFVVAFHGGADKNALDEVRRRLRLCCTCRLNWKLMNAAFISRQRNRDQADHHDQDHALFAFRKNENPDQAFHFCRY